ncbi:unnamed protein product [Caenorhabditis bovis]|uniref:Uncharacterized protein n=1 Tax=Caenorhabditis bovis TaxID=2654633 RepID=A0A8S1F1W8_9PELO|nr:unnamed protein product [Caenorhabditis bovis]
MSLFGTTPATSQAKPLFGTTSTPSSGTLFGNTTTPSTGLFGSTATSSAAPSLFGSTTTTTTSQAGTLFGTTSKPATTTTSATGSLFGTTTTTSTIGGGSLFGSSTTTATSTTSTGTAFGSTPTTQANTSLGLGGVQQQQKTLGGAATTTATTTSTTGEKEAAKDGELQGANEIRQMIPALEERLKKNRDIMEEVENMPVDNSISIDELIDKARSWINEVRRNVRDANDMSNYVAELVSEDKYFLDTAKRLQDASNTSNQTTLCNLIKRHLYELTDKYDVEMGNMQQRVEAIRTKFERLLSGEPALSMEELDELFKRCDSSYANAQARIHETGREIEALKNQLIEQGYTHLRKTYQQHLPKAAVASNEGAEFFPSHSSLAMIGSSLRAPATATAPTVGGIGLGTGTGLFGSSTGGTSLFGSTNTTKPAFTGGSLFGNLTNPSTTTSTTAATTTTSSSLFSSFNTKPATTIASTVTNNSSGLLFSMKK